jgi:hypothetical protein
MERLIGAMVRRWWGFKHVRVFERATSDPETAQRQRLFAILRRNRNTVFGRSHRFATVDTVADFQRCVPMCDYAALEPYIEDMRQGKASALTVDPPIMYAMTSGTTAQPKYIPVTRTYLAEYLHGLKCNALYAARAHPEAAACVLTLTSAAETERAPSGVPCGAIAGLLVERQPRFIRRRLPVPPEVSRIQDIDTRYYLLLRLALSTPVTAIVAAGPAALIMLLRKLEAWAEPLIRDLHDGTLHRPVPMGGPFQDLSGRLRPLPARAKALEAAASAGLTARRAWPTLALVSCWTRGPMALYLETLQQHLGEVPIRELGYLATEGRGTINVDDHQSVLAVTSHFFEFVPEEKMGDPEFVPLTCSRLEVGRTYYVLFTTSAGLYRYHINDIIRVTGFYRRAPVVEFVRKGLGTASIAGEKLTEEQVVLALREARQQTGVAWVHCTAAPVWADPPYYALYVEPDDAMTVAETEALAATVDAALARFNMEYQQKRATHRLGPLVVRIAPAGTYERLFKQIARRGGPDTQVKLPVLTADLDFERHMAMA